MKRCNSLLTLLCAFTIFPVCVMAQNTQARPDIILHNAKVLTVDNNFSMAEAVAVTGQKIAAVGKNADITKLAGPNTQVIDVKGRTIVPGLIDTHRHMYNYAENTYGGEFGPEEFRRYPVDWRGVTSKEDVLNQIKGMMDKYKFKPGEWVYFVNQLMFISGGTVEQAKILYDDLSRFDIDKVAPNHPVILSMGIPDFMGVMVNTKALDILMAQHGDIIKTYGRYWITPGGLMDGHLEPPASRLALPYTYDRSPEILAKMYKGDMHEMTSMGMTTVTTRLPKDSVAAYKLLESRGELTVRVAYGNIEAFGTVKDFKKELPVLAKQVGTGTDKVWITGVGPTAVDGVTTRACTDQKRLKAYGVIDSWFPSGQCHYDIEYRGAKGKSGPIRGNYYREWTLESGMAGLRFANVHVAGDRSHALIFNLVEQIQQQKGPQATKNWAVDHCDQVNPADFKRAAKLGIIFSCYVARSIEEGKEKADSYGEKVAHTFLSPVKSLLDAGAKVVLESDTNSYIWNDIEKCVTRKDKHGNVWGPQEKVDRTIALRMITRWAADYVLRGDQLGSIEPGKIADILVLDKDYMSVPEEEIHTVQADVNVFDGKIVYVRSAFAKENNLRPAGALISSYKELVATRKPTTIRGLGGG
ncbi:MAG: amidohydrolase family protein [Acidobacteria bacterium]|nr:amidohydrolase family protein [Acidobacteriota bacterium]